MQKISAMTKNGLPLGVCLNIGVSTIFALVAAFLIYQVKVQMRGQAMVEAETKARLILDRNLATHTYFSHMLKPHVFSMIEASLSPDYFDPVWMSSTYAVREIDKFFKKLTDQSYYYKECAINARSPENEADTYEKAFLEALNKDSELMTWSGIRELDGMSYYVTMRRGEVMEQSCLRCHSTPAEAPAKLVEAYGPEFRAKFRRGYFRHLHPCAAFCGAGQCRQFCRAAFLDIIRRAFMSVCRAVFHLQTVCRKFPESPSR